MWSLVLSFCTKSESTIPSLFTYISMLFEPLGYVKEATQWWLGNSLPVYLYRNDVLLDTKAIEDKSNEPVQKRPFKWLKGYHKPSIGQRNPFFRTELIKKSTQFLHFFSWDPHSYAYTWNCVWEIINVGWPDWKVPLILPSLRSKRLRV